MVKTTVYLPDELKAALSREAARSNVSEAELIRSAIEARVGQGERPRPQFGALRGPALTVSEMDEALADGFGER